MQRPTSRKPNDSANLVTDGLERTYAVHSDADLLGSDSVNRNAFRLLFDVDLGCLAIFEWSPERGP